MCSRRAAATRPVHDVDRLLNQKPSYSAGRLNEYDFRDAALYLLVVQSVASCVVAALTTCLAASLLPASSVNCIRTLALGSLFSGACVYAPLRIDQTLGIAKLRLFHVLRIAPALLMSGFGIQQLSYVKHEQFVDEDASLLVAITGVIAIILLLLAAAVRVYQPTSRSDMSFLLAVCGCLLLSLFTQPSTHQTETERYGPLQGRLGMLETLDRAGRAVLFSGLYCAHALANPPRIHTRIDEVILASTRAASSVIYVMAIKNSLILYPTCIVHLTALIVRRIQLTSHLAYDTVAMESDVEEGRGRDEHSSDEELPPDPVRKPMARPVYTPERDKDGVLMVPSKRALAPSSTASDTSSTTASASEPPSFSTLAASVAEREAAEGAPVSQEAPAIVYDLKEVSAADGERRGFRIM